MLTLTQIRLVIPMTISLLQPTLCILVKMLFHGLPGSNARVLAPPQKPSIAPSPTPPLNYFGSVIFSRNLVVRSPKLLSSIVIGATYVSANPVFHSKMKHVGLDYHFVRENVQAGLLRISYISTNDQLADALTKPLSRATYTSLVRQIGLSSWPPNSRGRDKD